MHSIHNNIFVKQKNMHIKKQSLQEHIQIRTYIKMVPPITGKALGVGKDKNCIIV